MFISFFFIQIFFGSMFVFTVVANVVVAVVGILKFYVHFWYWWHEWLILESHSLSTNLTVFWTWTIAVFRIIDMNVIPIMRFSSQWIFILFICMHFIYLFLCKISSKLNQSVETDFFLWCKKSLFKSCTDRRIVLLIVHILVIELKSMECLIEHKTFLQNGSLFFWTYWSR